MRTPSSVAVGILVLGLLLAGAPASAKNVLGSRIPDPVMKTFRAHYPRATIEKLDLDVEEGVEVYDFEFRDGKVEREADIAGDGTLLERTLVIRAKAVPAVAMRAIRKAAGGAALGRIEHIDIDYETRDGKVVRLAKPITRYAAEMTKGGRRTEVIVNADGSVAEAPQW